MEHTHAFHPRKMWVLLLGSSLSTFGIFLSLPLVSMHVLQVFHLSTYEIGFLAGIWPITVTSCSFLCGMAADRWGYLLALRLSALINSMAFIFLALAPSVPAFAIGLILFGLGKGFFDSSIRSAMTCVCPVNLREKYFRIRYMLQNVACIVGPLVGVVAYKYLEAWAFGLSSFAYVLFFLLALLLKSKDFKSAHDSVAISLLAKLRVARDMRLLSLVLSGVLLLMAYGAYEAFMPVVVANSSGHRPEFGILVSWNAAVVVIFQLVHLRFLTSFSTLKSAALGAILMMSGFLIFSLEFEPYVLSFVAVLIFSIGEGFLSPCFDILIDKIAPARQKALYFGAGEFKQVGFFLGSAAGGLVLGIGGNRLLFLSCAAWIALSAFALYGVHVLLRRRNSLAIIGLPFGRGQKRSGLEKTPGHFRQAGLVREMENQGWAVEDLGDVTLDNAKEDPSPWQIADTIRRRVAHADAAQNVLAIGGDHSTVVGTIQSSLEKHPDLAVLWIDAHGDINTEETSPTGNAHGMPLAALLGHMPLSVKGPYLPPQRLALIGVRSLDPGEVDLISKLNIRYYTVEDVRRRGMDTVLKEIAELFSMTRDSPIHVSFDIDVVDPSVAPDTGIHVPGGFDRAEVQNIAQWVSQSARLVSLDLVEVNLELGGERETALATLDIAVNFARTAFST